MKTALAIILMQVMLHGYQVNYDRAYDYLIKGRYHTAIIYINRAIRWQVTQDATLLKARIMYEVNIFEALYIYNLAKRMGDVPPYQCVMKGKECAEQYHDWELLNHEINNQ